MHQHAINAIRFLHFCIIISSSSIFVTAILFRLTTIMSSDRIFVIARGQLVECGTHSELLQLRGSYFNLWNNSAPS